MHERDARRAGHLRTFCVRYDRFARAPLQHGQVVAVLVGAHAGFIVATSKVGDWSREGQRPTVSQGGAQHVGGGLHHPESCFGAEDAVESRPGPPPLGAPEGLVQHFVLGGTVEASATQCADKPNPWPPPPI